MTLVVAASLPDGFVNLGSSVGQTVANAGADTGLNDFLAPSVGDCRIYTVRVTVVTIATAQTDAIVQSDYCEISIVDPSGSMVEWVGTTRMLKTGTARVGGYVNCNVRRAPLLLVHYGLRAVFRSPDTNATATGSFAFNVTANRLRLP